MVNKLAVHISSTPGNNGGRDSGLWSRRPQKECLFQGSHHDIEGRQQGVFRVHNAIERAKTTRGGRLHQVLFLRDMADMADKIVLARTRVDVYRKDAGAMFLFDG